MHASVVLACSAIKHYPHVLFVFQTFFTIECFMYLVGEMTFRIGIVGYLFVVLPYTHPLTACLYPSAMFILPTLFLTIYKFRTAKSRQDERFICVIHVLWIFIFAVTFAFSLYRSSVNIKYIDKKIFIPFAVISGPLMSLKWSFSHIWKCDPSSVFRLSLLVVFLRVISAIIAFLITWLLYKEFALNETEFTETELTASLLGSYNSSHRTSVTNITVDIINFDSEWTVVRNVSTYLVVVLVLHLFAIDACRIRARIFGFAIPLLFGDVLYFVFWLIVYHTGSSDEVPYFGNLKNVFNFGDFYDDLSVPICYILCLLSFGGLLWSRGAFNIPSNRLNKPNE